MLTEFLGDASAAGETEAESSARHKKKRKGANKQPVSVEGKSKAVEVRLHHKTRLRLSFSAGRHATEACGGKWQTRAG